AKLLPIPQRFGSNVHLPDKRQRYPVGELPSPLMPGENFVNGANTAGKIGHCYVGSPQSYLTGVDLAADSTPKPPCCKSYLGLDGFAFADEGEGVGGIEGIRLGDLVIGMDGLAIGDLVIGMDGLAMDSLIVGLDGLALGDSIPKPEGFAFGDLRVNLDGLELDGLRVEFDGLELDGLRVDEDGLELGEWIAS